MTYIRMGTVGTVALPFALTSVTQMQAPEGDDVAWQRYVISQGDNRIEGMRRGEHDEVSTLLAALVARLNGRFSKPSGNAIVRGRSRWGRTQVPGA